jgi:hypothetical protein
MGEIEKTLLGYVSFYTEIEVFVQKGREKAGLQPDPSMEERSVVGTRRAASPWGGAWACVQKRAFAAL